MKYRKFGRIDWQASVLGFGCMRFPIKNDDVTQIDEPEATRMLYHAIDQGVNYVDTAYPYHGGSSERLLGKILIPSYRAKIKLASKMSPWLVNTAQDLDRIFSEQLERLQTDFIDLYLLHSLNERSWNTMRELGSLEWLERKKAEGRIGIIGFSFHDDFPVFKQIVDAYDWDFCQIQHNYMDIDNQAGTQGLQYAAAKGMAVVIMEPLLGGKLVDPPQRIQQVFDTASTPRTAADWALQWLWNQPEPTVVLSGMSTMAQVEENLKSAESSGVGTLTAEDLQIIQQVRDIYVEACPIPCTKCKYCMPCPQGVDIPRNFEVYNQGLIYDKPENVRVAYQFVSEESRANNCIQCRECEELCPQGIEISQWMPRVHQVLAEGAPYSC